MIKGNIISMGAEPGAGILGLRQERLSSWPWMYL